MALQANWEDTGPGLGCPGIAVFLDRLFLGITWPGNFYTDLTRAMKQLCEWLIIVQHSQYSQMHMDRLPLWQSPRAPHSRSEFAQQYNSGKEAGLPGPGESLSKPVKSTEYPAAEPAYSWPSWPSASFDLRIRPHHECPYCHVLCTQCVNY